MDKKSLAEMRKELRELRKEHVKPASRMRKGDISAEIERLRGNREETPAAAAVPSAPLRKSRAAVESVKEAKASEFPVRPDAREKPTKMKAAPKAPAAKSKMSKAALRQMLEDLTSDEE